VYASEKEEKCDLYRAPDAREGSCDCLLSPVGPAGSSRPYRFDPRQTETNQLGCTGRADRERPVRAARPTPNGTPLENARNSRRIPRDSDEALILSAG
jgi:hypothetical protein